VTATIEVSVFTLYSIAVLAVTIGLSYYEILYRMWKPKLLVVPVVLVFMLVHQFTELITFLEAGSIQSQLVAETFETAANTFAAVGVYYGLHLVRSTEDLATRLEESERQYRTLTENSPLPILVIDDGAVAFANRAASDLFAAEEASVVEGESIAEFVHPDDRERFEECIASLRADPDGDGTRTLEHRLCGFEGEFRDVITAAGCGTYDGREAMYMILRDVTREREYEREMERVQAQFQTTLDSSNDAIFLLDPDENTILEANEAAVDLLAYDHEELLGMSAEHIHPHERTQFEEFRHTVLEEGNVLTDELSCLTKRGEQIPVEISASRVETEQGPGILAIARDISDRKRRHQQISVLRRLLRHNLRNEMTVVIGNAEVIEERVEDESLENAAASIRDRSEALIETSREVRDLERFIRQSSERPDELDLVPIVTDVVSTCREQYPEARIETDLPGTTRILGIDALGWAIEHLIENAIEHNPGKEPWVCVRVESRRTAVGHRHVDLVVEDDGPGIPDGELAVVDADVEQTPVHHGSGVGLHAVSQVVDILGGETEISDRKDGGSRVRLTLPAGESDTAEAVAHS